MKKHAIALIALLISFFLIPLPGQAEPVCEGNNCTITFGYTGSMQTWHVPDGAINLSFEIYGASGARGGGGGGVTGDLVEVPDTLYIFVGGAGSQGVTAAGGYNGGGRAGGNRGNEGSGGGATDIRTGLELEDRILVAGGGGGGGGYSGASGAAGGGLIASSGASGQGGGGGGGGGSSYASATNTQNVEHQVGEEELAEEIEREIAALPAPSTAPTPEPSAEIVAAAPQSTKSESDAATSSSEDQSESTSPIIEVVEGDAQAELLAEPALFENEPEREISFPWQLALLGAVLVAAAALALRFSGR